MTIPIRLTPNTNPFDAIALDATPKDEANPFDSLGKPTPAPADALGSVRSRVTSATKDAHLELAARTFGTPATVATDPDNGTRVLVGQPQPTGLVPQETIARARAGEFGMAPAIEAGLSIARADDGGPATRGAIADANKRILAARPPGLASTALNVGLSHMADAASDRAGDVGTEQAMERYAAGGGDIGAHANLMGASGFLGNLAGQGIFFLGGGGEKTAVDGVRAATEKQIGDRVGQLTTELRSALDGAPKVALNEAPETADLLESTHRAYVASLQDKLGKLTTKLVELREVPPEAAGALSGKAGARVAVGKVAGAVNEAAPNAVAQIAKDFAVKAAQGAATGGTIAAGAGGLGDAAFGAPDNDNTLAGVAARTGQRFVYGGAFAGLLHGALGTLGDASAYLGTKKAAEAATTGRSPLSHLNTVEGAVEPYAPVRVGNDVAQQDAARQLGDYIRAQRVAQFPGEAQVGRGLEPAPLHPVQAPDISVRAPAMNTAAAPPSAAPQQPQEAAPVAPVAPVAPPVEPTAAPAPAQPTAAAQPSIIEQLKQAVAASDALTARPEESAVPPSKLAKQLAQAFDGETSNSIAEGNARTQAKADAQNGVHRNPYIPTSPLHEVYERAHAAVPLDDRNLGGPLRAPVTADGAQKLADDQENVAIARHEEVRRPNPFDEMEELSQAHAEEEAARRAKHPLNPRNLIGKSHTELQELADKESKSEHNAEVEVFGEEGAKRYKAAQRTLNSPMGHLDDEKYSQASVTVHDMESNLTTEQSNRLFGIADGGLNAEELRRAAGAARDYAPHNTFDMPIEDLYSTIGRELTTGSPEKHFDAALRLKGAVEEIQRRTSEPMKDVLKRAVLERVHRGYADVKQAGELLNSTLEAMQHAGVSLGEPKEHDYNSTQINLPQPLRESMIRRASTIPERDMADDGIEYTPHVTVKYGLHGQDTPALRAKLAELLADEPPIQATLGKSSLFKNDDADVLKLDVESPDLHRINRKIAEAFPHTDTHPEYVPHATLAYLKPGRGDAHAGDTTFEGHTVEIPHVTLSDRTGNKFDIPLRGTRRAQLAAPDVMTENPFDAIADSQTHAFRDSSSRGRPSKPPMTTTTKEFPVPEALPAEFNTPEIQQARADAAAMPKTSEINTAARVAWRAEQARALADGATKFERRVDLVLGLPGSGKTSTTVEPLLRAHGGALLDSDLVKRAAPEWDGGLGAQSLHVESGGVREMALQAAVEKGANIVFPTMGDPSGTVHLAKALMSVGYHVHVHFVDLPNATAARRVLSGWKSGERHFVDPAAILRTGDEPRRGFAALAALNGVTAHDPYSNDVPRGSPPRRIVDWQREWATATDRNDASRGTSDQPLLGAGRPGRDSGSGRSAREDGEGPSEVSQSPDRSPASGDRVSRSELTAQAVRDFAEDVQRRLGLERFELHLTRDGDIVGDTIVVPRDARNRGTGSEAMERLAEFADEHQRRILVTPASPGALNAGTSSRARLVRFYKRFGFVENTGKRRDLAISEAMYRNPTPATHAFAESSAPSTPPRPPTRSGYDDAVAKWWEAKPIAWRRQFIARNNAIYEDAPHSIGLADRPYDTAPPTLRERIGVAYVRDLSGGYELPTIAPDPKVTRAHDRASSQAQHAARRLKQSLNDMDRYFDDAEERINAPAHGDAPAPPATPEPTRPQLVRDDTHAFADDKTGPSRAAAPRRSPKADGTVGSLADADNLPNAAGLEHERSAIRPREIAAAVRALFNPEGLGPAARATAGTIRDEGAAGFRQLAIVNETLRAFGRDVGRLKKAEAVKHWDAAERGMPTGDATFDAGAKQLQEATQKFTEELIALDRLKAEATIENWIGRFWDRSGGGSPLDFLRRAKSKRPLEGPKSFLKRRSWDYFVDGLNAIADAKQRIKDGVEEEGDAEIAAMRPATYNYVDSQLAKLAEMQRVISAEKMLRAERASGRARAFKLGAELPVDENGDEWIRIGDGTDPAFTVYGPPTHTISESYDAGVRQGLEAAIRRIGNVQHVRGVSVGGGKLGWATVTGDKMASKFGTHDGVIMHELGHVLDAKYPIRAKLAANARTSNELKKLAQLRYEHLPEASEKFKEYVMDPAEQMANALHALIHAPDRMQSVAPNAKRIITDYLKSRPELAPILNIKPSLSLGTSKAEARLAGPQLIGYWYAPRASAAVWNNFLSRGWRGNALLDAIMAPAQASTQILLGLSGFHATTIATEGMFSDLALAIDHLANGGSTTEAVTSVLRAPAAPFRMSMKGRKIMQEYRAPGTHPELAKVLDAMIAGGYRGTAQLEYINGDRLKKLKKAFSEAVDGEHPGARLWGAAKVPLDALWAGIEIPTQFLMGRYVPWMKTAATYELVARELAKLPQDAPMDQVHGIMGDVVKEMDLRFGQVTYENWFIHNAAKHLAQLVFLAPGWTFGTATLTGRGLKQTAQIPARAAERVRRFAGQEVPKDTPEPLIGKSAAYWIGAVLGTMLINAWLTRAHTGETPHGKDFFAYRDGTKDADGNANRHRIPGYLMHDVYGYATHPVDMLRNKLAPTLAFFERAMQNRDYFGDMLYDPEAPLATRAKQLGGAAVKGLGTPLSVQNYLEDSKRNEHDAGDMLRNAFGVTPAKREFVRTDAQNLMADFLARRGHDARTPDQVDAAEARAQVGREYRNGERSRGDVLQLERAGELSRNQSRSMLRSARESGLVQKFDRLSIDEAEAVFKLATEDERELWWKALQHKRGTARRARARGKGEP